MVKRTDHIGSFQATGKNGEITIDVYQDFIGVGDLSNPTKEVPGLKIAENARRRSRESH